MKGKLNTIYNVDSRRISEVFPEGLTIQTTISSPPYYDMKDYGVDGQVGFGQSYSDYLDDIGSIYKQVFELTADDGTLWIIVDTFKRGGDLVLLPFDIAEKLKKVGWLLQNIIIWKKDKTVPWASGGFVQRKFEYVLFFSKCQSFKSHGDKVRVYDTSQLKSWWVKYPERYNPKGKAIDEIWEFPIPVQGSWGKEYIRHFCPLPKEMVATMISLSSDEGDLVFDPFSGTGAVLSQAAYMKRNYIGFELNSEYVEQCKSYINDSLNSGREDYIKSLDVNAQINFERNIISLKALKYGRQLLVKVEEKLNIKGQLKVFVGTPRVDGGFCHVSYIFMGGFDSELMQGVVLDLIKEPPLSKYRVTPELYYNVEYSHNSELFFYSRTNTNQYLRNMTIDSPRVAVISPICVDINEKEYQ